MSWNNRVIRRFHDSEEYFEIHEVYYDEKGNPDGVTEDGIVPFGDTLEELREELQRFLDACKKPILNYDDF